MRAALVLALVLSASVAVLARPPSAGVKEVCPQVGQPVESSVRFIEPAKWDAAKKYLINVYIPGLNAVAGHLRGIFCFEDRKQYSITCNTLYKDAAAVAQWSNNPLREIAFKSWEAFTKPGTKVETIKGEKLLAFVPRTVNGKLTAPCGVQPAPVPGAAMTIATHYLKDWEGGLKYFYAKSVPVISATSDTRSWICWSNTATGTNTIVCNSAWKDEATSIKWEKHTPVKDALVAEFKKYLSARGVVVDFVNLLVNDNRLA